MILILSGVLVFFGFLFSIFFFNSHIFGNPFTFIFSFFALLFLIAFIFIAGVFMIQKSTKQKNFGLRIRNKFENPLYGKENINITSEYIKKSNISNDTKLCANGRSEVFDADIFCLNCGNKI